jgi:hypothetical protein
VSGFAVSWDARQQEIVDELRHQATWNWGLLTPDQLVARARESLTPSAERVRAAMAALVDDGVLVLDDSGRLTAPADGDR